MTIFILGIILVSLLLSSSLMAVLGTRFGEQSHKICVASMALAFAGALLILWSVTSTGPVFFELKPFSDTAPDWMRVNFYVDRLSAVMMVLITSVSAVINVYSVRYMQGDSGYARFFSMLGYTTMVLLAMVTSGSLFMLVVWWQLVSWLLYLLLSHNHENAAAVQSAFKTFVILRIGDAALLCGVLLAYRCFGTLTFPAVFERAAADAQTLHLWVGGPVIGSVTAITLLMFAGAMAKSAQLPLHVWLPATMDAPTPVSAFMHAGIVNAGGFLINRLAPLYGASPDTLHIVFVVGLFTAIAGTAIMLTRSDVKTKLGFSTMGQMGFMIMECGLGAFALAIFHLISHGIFKATLFLSAGSVIHKVRKDPHLPATIKKNDPAEFRRLSWTTGVLMTLLLPLVILLVANKVVEVNLSESQGTVILLFFAWVTSSQAILGLYSLKTMESWKVATAMVLTVFFIVVTYVWATEAFTCFLYPTAGEASAYFHAAAFPLWVFDLLVGVILLLLLSGWYLSYSDRRRKPALIPRWLFSFIPSFYMWFWNRLYLDRLYAVLGLQISRAARRLDATLPDWLP
jgi:NADH-quinone oxidoreductase subunit L